MENQTEFQHQAYVSNQPQFNGKLEEPLSVKDWLISMLILLIPLVNIIMVFVWAFGEGKESKKNFFKAYLIFLAIGIVLYILSLILFGAAILSVLGSGM